MNDVYFDGDFSMSMVCWEGLFASEIVYGPWKTRRSKRLFDL